MQCPVCKNVIVPDNDEEVCICSQCKTPIRNLGKLFFKGTDNKKRDYCYFRIEIGGKERVI